MRMLRTPQKRGPLFPGGLKCHNSEISANFRRFDVLYGFWRNFAKFGYVFEARISNENPVAKEKDYVKGKRDTNYEKKRLCTSMQKKSKEKPREISGDVKALSSHFLQVVLTRTYIFTGAFFGWIVVVRRRWGWTANENPVAEERDYAWHCLGKQKKMGENASNNTYVFQTGAPLSQE